MTATGGHVLEVDGLRAGVRGQEILRGVDLTVRSGEVHAVMGPNGSGKSTLAHVLMGRPGYEVLGGSVRLDGRDILALPTWERAQAGLFLALQYPVEVPGVALSDAMAEALTARRADTGPVGRAQALALLADEAREIGFAEHFLDRAINVDLSGGEKKRNETVQLGVLGPSFAVLDELDSGLDVDALRAVSRRIERATQEENLGVVAITHYTRLLHVLHADAIHVISKGQIVRTGGPELAEELERTGYVPYQQPDEIAGKDVSVRAADDPFADPLA